MKRLNLFISVALVISMLLSLQIPLSASLYHKGNATDLLNGDEFFTPRLTTDPYFAYYYISKSYTFVPYAQYARIGVEAWNSTDYDIDLTETTSYASSVCDIKGFTGSTTGYNGYYDNINGYAVVYCGNGPYSGTSTPYYRSDDIPDDYWAGEVYINYDQIPSSSLNTQTTQNKLRVVVAHEVGHVLGLGHVTSQSCIMYNVYTPTEQNIPLNSEKSAVRYLYNYR